MPAPPAAQELPGDMTAEHAQAPTCTPLVTNMCTLLARLCELSRLDVVEQRVRGLRVGKCGVPSQSPTEPRCLAARLIPQRQPLPLTRPARQPLHAGRASGLGGRQLHGAAAPPGAGHGRPGAAG